MDLEFSYDFKVGDQVRVRSPRTGDTAGAIINGFATRFDEKKNVMMRRYVVRLLSDIRAYTHTGGYTWYYKGQYTTWNPKLIVRAY